MEKMDVKSEKPEGGGFERYKRQIGIVLLLIMVAIGLLVSPLVGIGILLWIGICFVFLKLIGNSSSRDTSFSSADSHLISREVVIVPSGIPLPYVIMNSDKKILAQNVEFKAITTKNESAKKDFALLLEKMPFSEEKQQWKINDKIYGCYCHPYKRKEQNSKKSFAICLVDETKTEELKEKLEAEKPVAALIFLDNYEEVEESVEESQLPMLTALIDRKLNTMAANVGGIMKKFEKDRYIFVFTYGMLEKLKEKKFDILNEIKETNIGEHIPLTLSMGVGVGSENLDSAMKNAKAAIDLALGRGGDQVLIKDGEKFLFYGGKSGAGVHNSRIRARVKADALWELMGEASEVLVMGHKQPDLDSLGACIGIYTIAKTMGKHCYIVMDEVSVGVKRLCDRMQHTGEYEKLFLNGETALRMVSNKTLVVVTDTHRFGMTECPAILKRAKKIVLFDHHRKSTDFIENAVLIYHEPYASSTSEMITEMIQYFGEKIKLKPIEADALLAGITVDTKNFCVKTGPVTFEAAAFLRRNGADGVRVRLLFQNDMGAYKAKATAVRDAKIFRGNMAISVCPSNVENTTLTAAQAADDLLNVTGIQASFVSCQLQDTIYISARSFGEVNVQRIMEKLGGGGHHTVAGAQLIDSSLEEAEKRIKDAITEYLEEEN